MPFRVVILAAGSGTRMRSVYPKLIHPVLGLPLITYVLSSVKELEYDEVILVVGENSDAIRESAAAVLSGIEFVTQPKQLGTGDALRVALGKLGEYTGDLLVLNGDLPAITSATLNEFLSNHRQKDSVFSLISADIDDPGGYGRVVRDIHGELAAIVEDRDANIETAKIKEFNSGAYCLDSEFAKAEIDRIVRSNSQGEYYLPQLLQIAAARGKNVYAHKVDDFREVLGVNTRKELADVEKVLRKRINSTLMNQGVSIPDPDTTYVSPLVSVGSDTVIHPNTYVYGNTSIGSFCSVGPSAYIENSEIGDNTVIRFSSYLSGCSVASSVTVGPFAHLRPGSSVSANAKIGNFVEIKKSKIGKGSKVPHLSYIGDAILGENVNIGAGTITCNYDGFDKHRTTIDDLAFIGSDTMLVAPVRIGKGATTAAGSTITRDVSEGSLAIERSKQKEIRNWMRKPKKNQGEV